MSLGTRSTSGSIGYYGTRRGRQATKPSSRGLLVPLLSTGLLILFGMTIYQIVKYHAWPGMTLLESNVTTVVFSVVSSIVVAYFVLRKQLALNHRANEELELRRRAEVKLKEYQESLEQEVRGRTSELLESNRSLTRHMEELKATESALRESQSRYHSLFMKSHAVMMLMDPDSGQLLDANQAATRFYGYSRAELLSKKISDINILSLDEIKQHMATALSLDGRQYQFRHRLADGRVRDVMIYSGPITIDGKRLLYAIVHDITDQVRAEQEKKILAMAVEQASESIFIMDQEGSLLYLNPAFERISGYSGDEVLNRNISLLKGLDTEENGGSILSKLNHGKAWTGRFSCRAKDGRPYLMDGTITPLRDANGEITHHVAVRRDVTEEVRLREELRQSQKMEAIGTLAGGIAHDFNNILAIITANAEMGARKLDPNDSTGRYLEKILLASARASHLVRQILTFSRRNERAVKPLRLTPLVKECLQLLRATLPANVELNVNAATQNDTVMADPTEMHQVLMNLCANGGHAMGEAGGRLDITLSEETLAKGGDSRVPDLAPGRYVSLSVSDTGCGMTDDVKKRIFEPYFSTKGPTRGTGLGLAVVHGIITGYKGSITVNTTEGTGTEFKIYLPFSTGEQAQSSPIPKLPMRQPQAGGGKECILLVDDESQIVEVAQEVLECLGFRVVSEVNSERAYETFRDNPDQFDLVITDRTMPRLTGLELSRKIKEIRPDLPVVLCTGYHEADMLEMVREAGIDHLVNKPFMAADITEAVQAVLGEGAANASLAAARA